MRKIGIAHLSLLQLEPDELVRVAATAGFDFVGVRVRGATPAETITAQTPGSRASRATLAALRDTGVTVTDIEFLSLDGATGREAWLPMLEAGAELGASIVNLAGQDPEPQRLQQSLGELVVDAQGFGITPALEPISYNAISTASQAATIASAAGAYVMLDPLHLQRGGTSIADVAALDASLVPALQLCDGPLGTPETLQISAPLPRGMTADGEPRKLESRALRLAPGDGEFPLAELLRAVPAGVPVSVEVPNAALVEQLGVTGYARYLYAAATRVLAEAGAE